MFVQKRKITAAEEVEEEVVEKDVEIDPEATDLLFEAEDVAELIAEVTDKVVEVSVDGEDIIFSVGDDEFTVTPEGDEELVESSTRVMKRPVAAKRRVERKSSVKANTNTTGKAIRKVRK